jgi:hypothetical protein
MSKTKAPKECNSVDFLKAKKLKEKHEHREAKLDKREEDLNKQKELIRDAKQ